MSIPKEIQDIVDACEKEGLQNIIVALFAEYGSDYIESEKDWKEGSPIFNKITKDAEYELMEVKGGAEGEGEYCYSVIRIGEKFFKAEWSYYSYHGQDFDYLEDTIEEVHPKEMVITIYE